MARNQILMLYEHLDPSLESALDDMCAGDWKKAQSQLSQRLDASGSLGRRRLNLFLLAVVAARGGHSQVAEQLREAARATPAEMSEPRYLGQGSEELRIELQRAWWEFNRWAPESGPLTSPSAGRDDLDWAAVLDAALEGRSGEMERRWSAYLDDEHPQKNVLWNLLALSYLESGDLRTYEEMRDSAVALDPAPPLPPPLEALLSQAGLDAALADLRSGRWLTSERLSAPSREPNHSSSEEHGGEERSWTEQMEAAFSLLSVGRGVDAARLLGPLCGWGDGLEQAYALNALALALFSSGEYGQAELALADFRGVAAAVDPSSRPELAQRYGEWLASVGAVRAPNSVYCDPFAVELSRAPEMSAEEGEERFWQGFEEVLEEMRLGHLQGCGRALRSLVAEPLVKQSTYAFLTALLFAGSSLLDGDHLDAQESIDDAAAMFQAGGLCPAVLSEARKRLEAAGASTLAGKMDLDGLGRLDPWRDFPADFPQQSLSGF